MLTLDPEGSPTVGGPVLLGRDGRGLTRAFTRTKTLEGRYTFGRRPRTSKSTIKIDRELQQGKTIFLALGIFD